MPWARMSDIEPAQPEGHAFPSSCPCANVYVTSGKQCDNVGVKACTSCYLVLYCSSECQKRHWAKHKADCKSKLMKTTWQPAWEVEKRQPSFINNSTSIADSMVSHGTRKFLWGNVPAFDVLNMQANEGADYDKDINLLFAASGDLRNVIKTINSIPSDFQPSITAVINDRDFDIVARNAIMMLTALYVESPGAAAATMLHTWYSALIPSAVLHTLRTTVLPLIQDVCNKIADKPADRVLAKTFTQGRCSLRLMLEKRCWVELLSYLEVPDNLTAEEAERVRRGTVLAEVRKDYIDRALVCQPREWRGATMQFRKHGILMPFGAATKSVFDTPNPTFFQERDVWPMMDSADPLNSWSLEDILQSTPLAKNDLYGGLFFHVRKMLLDFCAKLKMLKTSFVLLHKDAIELPKMLATDMKMMQSFDRIEVSNIADQYYLGLECLRIFAPTLRPLDENPAATLVTLFMNAIHEASMHEDTRAFVNDAMPRMLGYLPFERNPNKQITNSVKIHCALNILKDFDRLWERYKQGCSFDARARVAGVRAKSTNTIITPWPLRLREDASKAEFDKLLGSGHRGNERYVEWQRLPVTADGVADALADQQCVVC